MGYVGTKPADAALTSADIADGVVTADKLATDAVETAKVKDLNVTAGKLATDAAETAKIKDLNVTAGKLAATQDLSTKTITLPATVAGLGTGIDVTSQITGTVPTANLGSGSASASTYLAGDQSYKALSEYNDDALQNDIATLALHQATNANAAKYNLTNTNVDVFQDSTGVASFTDCSRNTAGEYISTSSTAVEAFTSDSDTVMLLHMEDTGLTDSSSNNHTMNITSGCARSAAAYKFGSYSAYFDQTAGNALYPDSSSDFAFGTGDWTWEFWLRPQGSGSSQTVIAYSPFNYNNVQVHRGGATSWTYYMGNTTAWSPVHGASVGTVSEDSFSHIAITRDGNTSRAYLNGVQASSNDVTGFDFTQTAPYIGENTALTEYKGYVDELRVSDVCRYPDGTTFTPNEVETSNATGNFVSTATTANASVSKVGIVLTYKNAAGTNTLNTDIIAQVSADGGSNYSTVTLTAGGTFSTGVLQAVANDVSVTAGTSIQYKISFANQASGSKEAQINGVSLIY